MIYNNTLETTHDNSTAPQHQCFQVTPSLPIFPKSVPSTTAWLNCPRLVMLFNLKASTNNEQLTGTYSLAANDDVGKNHKRLQLVRVVAPPRNTLGRTVGMRSQYFTPIVLLLVKNRS